MPRRMSVSLTIDAVRAHTKTVTRRHHTTWTRLQPGDHLTLIEKGMGLPKGTRQVIVAQVEIVDVRVESILNVDLDEVRREGFPDMSSWDFIQMWLASHGYQPDAMSAQDLEHTRCRRIEWRYLEEAS